MGKESFSTLGLNYCKSFHFWPRYARKQCHIFVPNDLNPFPFYLKLALPVICV